MKVCTKKKYAKYTFALSAASKFYKKYKEVQTPYFCRQCDGFHLTMKRANKKELSEYLLFKKGVLIES
jgi:hypothetical protein